MQFWTAVIIKKVTAGVVVKNVSGPGEFVLNWSVCALVEIDLANQIIRTDGDNDPWVAGDVGKAMAQKGVFVKICADQPGFPGSSDQVAGANYETSVKYVGPNQPQHYQPAALIIYHDFKKEVDGVSATAFSLAVVSHFTRLGLSTARIHATTSLSDTCGKIAALDNKKIDRLLIFTHGSDGQLWLGNADNPTFEDTMAQPTDEKKFANPVAFGNYIKQQLGAGLAISIFSCHFVHSEEGITVLKQFQQAAEARVVYASSGVVHFQTNTAGASTAVVDGGHAYAFYPGHETKRLSPNQIPIFDM